MCFKSLVFGIKSLSCFSFALTPLFCWAVWRVSVLFEFVHLSHSFPNIYWIINMCFAIIVVISQLCIFFFALCLSFCFFSFLSSRLKFFFGIFRCALFLRQKFSNDWVRCVAFGNLWDRRWAFAFAFEIDDGKKLFSCCCFVHTVNGMCVFAVSSDLKLFELI